MNFKKYAENIKEYIEPRDRIFHSLALVSDTANLIEKLKYFRGDNLLILVETGDVLFRVFALMNKFSFAVDNDPLNIEDLKMKTDKLDSKFSLSEPELIQNIIFELGIISNIMVENMRHDVEEFDGKDMIRLKTSMYSYILYMLILVCKYNFSIDKVLDANISRLKGKKKMLNMKIQKEGE